MKYYGKEVIHKALPEGSMCDYVLSCNEKRLDTVALNYFDRKITHRQMRENIDKCAAALIGYGTKAGDAVSLCVLAMPEAVYLLYAINKIGAVANMLVMNATEADIHDKLALAESKIVIAADIVLEKIIKASVKTTVEHVISVSFAESMPVIVGTLYKWKSKTSQFNCTDYREFLKAGKGITLQPKKADSKAPAIIAYTGGTTGKAKGVLLSNQAANVIAFQYKHSDKGLDFKDGEKFLDIIPPFLAYGLFFGVHMSLCCRFEVILCPDPAPEHFARLFIKYKPNHF